MAPGSASGYIAPFIDKMMGGESYVRKHNTYARLHIISNFNCGLQKY